MLNLSCVWLYLDYFLCLQLLFFCCMFVCVLICLMCAYISVWVYLCLILSWFRCICLFVCLDGWLSGPLRTSCLIQYSTDLAPCCDVTQQLFAVSVLLCNHSGAVKCSVSNCMPASESQRINLWVFTSIQVCVIVCFFFFNVCTHSPCLCWQN